MSDSGSKLGHYTVGEFLGKGAFSRVYVGMHDESGQLCALKLLDKASVAKAADSMRQVQRELAALSKIDNVNVLKLYDVEWNVHFVRPSGQPSEVILVALELASGGELFDFLSYTGAFEDQIARSYFRQLVSGLSACHSAGIVHRDLKPENIALSSDFVLKIIDFGLSAPNLAARSLITPCGTTAYMAPEIFNRQPYNGASTDIFAAGVVLFVSLAGFPPFQKASPADWWFHKLCTQQHDLFWQAHSRTAYFSPNAKDLLVRMLEPDPAKRITLEDVVAHPWFNGPTLDASALSHDMARRKAHIDSEKQTEALRCRAANAASLANRVDRGFDDPSEAPVPELLPSTGNGLLDIRTGVPADEAISAMEFALRKYDSSFDIQIDSTEFNIVAKITSSAGLIEFSARIYKERESADSAFVVRVRKVQGDSFAFRNYFNLLKSELTPVSFVDNSLDSTLTEAERVEAGDHDAF